MQHSSQTETSARRTQNKTRQQSRSPKKEQGLSHEPLALQAALDAILAGAGVEQIPAEAVLALSGRVGNSTLLSLLAQRETGPRLVAGPPPLQSGTQPLSCTPGQPQLEGAPAWDGISFPAGSPLKL